MSVLHGPQCTKARQMTLSLVNPDLTFTKSTPRNSLVGLPKKYHFAIMIWGLVLVREMFLKGLIYLMQYVWKNGECVVSFVAALCLYPEMHILSIWISVTSRKKETVLNFDNGKKTRKQKLGFLSRNKPIFLAIFRCAKILHIRRVFLHVQTNQRAVVGLSG